MSGYEVIPYLCRCCGITWKTRIEHAVSGQITNTRAAILLQHEPVIET
jgi:hypothetical protein